MSSAATRGSRTSSAPVARKLSATWRHASCTAGSATSAALRNTLKSTTGSSGSEAIADRAAARHAGRHAGAARGRHERYDTVR